MATDSEAEKAYRPAGLLESYHIARQNVGLDSCVVVAARFVRANSSNNEKLSKEDVYRAVIHALHTHAALSIRVVRQGDTTNTKAKEKNGKEVYLLERVESVNLEKAIHFPDECESNGTDGEGEGEENIAALIQHQFTRPMASVTSSSSSPKPEASSDEDKDTDRKNGPLWRLTITRKNTVLFAWHHCLGDGQSGLAVLRTLFDGLNTNDNDNSNSVLPPDFDPKSVKIPTNLQLTPPIEDLTDLSVSLRTLLSALLGLIIPHSWTSARKVWSGNIPPPSPPPFLTRVKHLFIPPDRVARILAASRKHQTTLTAVLYWFGVGILSDLVAKEDKDGRWKKLSISIPISLRPLAKVPQTAMGEMVSTHRSTPRLAPPSSLSSHSAQTAGIELDWPAISSFSKSLHASIPKSREVLGTIKYLNGKYEPFFLGKLGKKREASLEISNLGVFRLNVDSRSQTQIQTQPQTQTPDLDKWTITESYFAQDDGTTGAALKMNVVGSPSGSVNIVLTWGKDAVDDSLAEAFFKQLTDALDRLDRGLLSGEKSG